MFGWEFPPHISGGLGTACYGLTRGLSHISGMDIIFVVPKAFGDEDQTSVHLLGANEVVLTEKFINVEGFFRKIKLIEVGSKIIPYTDPEEYVRLSSEYQGQQVNFINTQIKGKLKFSGKYGPDLYQEIGNYALVAIQIALDNDFDVIHAHDWLTFPAGIAARDISGKPLIVHVHATDFDRSGGKVNPTVYQIEKNGFEAADKIITVSNLTRNTVIEKYGISPGKVVTIYNAVEPLSDEERMQAKRGINDKVVTFLGRITLQKGPEYFIEAAHKVLQKMDNVRFVMAGSGDMMRRMIRRAARLGITDKFHFTGFFERR